jgi:hypothetical protein
MFGKLMSGGVLATAILAAACSNGETASPEGTPTEGGTPGVGSTETRPVSTPDPGGRFRSTWPDTDFSNRTIDLGDILSGGVPIDGIPPLDAEGATSLPARNSGDANFLPADEIELAGNMPVAFIELNDEAKAYPLHILTWHEIVNDIVGGRPVAITFCPLCNTVLAFDREVDGEVLDFGVSGLLRHSDLVMWDRQTASWWQQATGESIVGVHAGTLLDILGAGIMSFADFKELHPDGMVLTEDTGLGRTYGQNPYVGYDTIGRTPFLFDGEVDDRLPAMERVVSLGDAEDGLAIPFSVLREQPVATVTVGGSDIVVFWAPGTASALDGADIAESEDIGSAIAYSPMVERSRGLSRARGLKLYRIRTSSGSPGQPLYPKRGSGPAEKCSKQDHNRSGGDMDTRSSAIADLSAPGEVIAGCPAVHRPSMRFRFSGRGPNQDRCLRHALGYRPVVRTAALTALVVGTVLTLINQGNILVAGETPAELIWKVPLTYSVPYMVSTWAALRISLRR